MEEIGNAFLLQGTVLDTEKPLAVLAFVDQFKSLKLKTEELFSLLPSLPLKP